MMGVCGGKGLEDGEEGWAVKGVEGVNCTSA